ncbi:MAG: hypothetical protein ACK58T_49995, partial [Phycisphaerae bacterium]
MRCLAAWILRAAAAADRAIALRQDFAYETPFEDDQDRVDFWRDGQGRVIQRALVAAGPRISLWNTHDVIRRDALGRIQQTDYA